MVIITNININIKLYFSDSTFYSIFPKKCILFRIKALILMTNLYNTQFYESPMQVNNVFILNKTFYNIDKLRYKVNLVKCLKN